MKFVALGCKSLRDGILVSSVFFLASLTLLLSARYLVPTIWHLPKIVSGMGIVLLLFALFILISTYLAAQVRRRKEWQEKNSKPMH